MHILSLTKRTIHIVKTFIFSTSPSEVPHELKLVFHQYMKESHQLKIRISHSLTDFNMNFLPTKECNELRLRETETQGFFGMKGFNHLSVFATLWI